MPDNIRGLAAEIAPALIVSVCCALATSYFTTKENRNKIVAIEQSVNTNLEIDRVWREKLDGRIDRLEEAKAESNVRIEIQDKAITGLTNDINAIRSDMSEVKANMVTREEFKTELRSEVDRIVKIMEQYGSNQ